MYGGLFGDLPSAKKAKKENSAGTSEKGQTKDELAVNTDKQVTTTTSTSLFDDTSSAAQTSKPPPLQRNSSATKKGSNIVADGIGGTTRTGSGGLVESVGTAGTSMAFIPTALKRRKKINRVVKRPGPNQSSTTMAAQSGPSLVPDATRRGSVEEINSTSSTVTSISKLNPSEMNTDAPNANNTRMLDYKNDDISKKMTSGSRGDEFSISKMTSIEKLSQGPIDIHGTSINTKHTGIPTSKGYYSHEEKYDLGDDHADVHAHSDTDNAATDMLPEEILDPYDPRIPNDLLQYRDRQALLAQQHQLEKETREALERQRVLREHLEEERNELQRQGNLSELGRGRGRGQRGVSNIPAWLEAKQRQERQGSAGDTII